MHNLLRPVALAIAVLFASAPASASNVNSFSVEAGSTSAAKMLRLGLQRDIGRTWFQGPRYHVGAYWELTAAAWRGDAYRDHPGVRQDLWEIGLTPTFRYQRNDRRGLYAEAGIGIHYLSEVWNNSGKELSTHFQFGDHIGAGYVFENGVDLALKFQHHSNGGIKKPNDGANFLIVKARFPF